MIEELEDERADELYEHHKIVADRGQQPLRVDKFLLNRLENTSRTKIQNAAEAGSIVVNGKAVKSNYKVKPFDEVSVVLPYPPREIELIPENIPVEILYQDDDLAVVNKNAGLVVHPGYGNYTGTLVNAMLFHFNQLAKNPDNEIRPGLVHRLDKLTSGVMVLAKTDYALSHLSKQFFDRTIDRRYRALVWGDVANDEGTITGNIGRSRKDRKIMDVYPVDSEEGKHAVTHYKVLERFGYVTLVECKLETGRTHQIRVHFQHIGHPLFNDPEYGGDKILKGVNFNKYKQFVENCFELIPGQALHAQTLGFLHPTKKKFLNFSAELPEGYLAILDKWKNYSVHINKGI
ncbi:MAG: RluA family pseudouridine synthase [Flavobacteriales bacterium]